MREIRNYIRILLEQSSLSELQSKVLDMNVANKKYNMNFNETKRGNAIGWGDTVLLLLIQNKPVAWFVYRATELEDMVEIYDTGMYVIHGMRNKGLGKELNRRMIKYFDKKYGRGKYYFVSTYVTRKGKRMADHRKTLVANPEDQVFDDSMESGFATY